jgi:hypothetical protein
VTLSLSKGPYLKDVAILAVENIHTHKLESANRPPFPLLKPHLRWQVAGANTTVIMAILVHAVLTHWLDQIFDLHT